MSKVRASQIISRAASQVGIKEVPAGSNCVKYNTWYYHRKAMGAAYAWCATFVSWLFAQFDALGLIGGKFARTDTKAKALSKSSRFKKGVSGLKAGDVVFFSFYGPRYQRRYLGIHHVGIYTGRQTKDGRYITVEGNTSVSSNDNGGKVMIRYRSASSIAAHFSPEYAPEPKKVPVVKKTTITIEKNLKRGSKGSQVKSLQRLLKQKKLYDGKIDGIYGAKTTAAVKKFQKKHELKVDGIVGKKTSAALGWKWKA